METLKSIAVRCVRLPMLILFGICFYLVWWLVPLVALVQFVLTALAQQPANPHLANFGHQLARYSQQIIDYLSYASDVKPFPFSSWPQGLSEAELAAIKERTTPPHAKTTEEESDDVDEAPFNVRSPELTPDPAQRDQSGLDFRIDR